MIRTTRYRYLFICTFSDQTVNTFYFFTSQNYVKKKINTNLGIQNKTFTFRCLATLFKIRSPSRLAWLAAERKGASWNRPSSRLIPTGCVKYSLFQVCLPQSGSWHFLCMPLFFCRWYCRQAFFEQSCQTSKKIVLLCIPIR